MGSNQIFSILIYGPEFQPMWGCGTYDLIYSKSLIKLNAQVKDFTLDFKSSFRMLN